MKLQSKNIIIYLLLSLLPLSIVGVVTYKNSEEMIKKSIGEMLEHEAHETARNMDKFLHNIYHMARTWARAGVMQEVVSGDKEERISPFLTNLNNEYKYFFSIDAADVNGVIVASSVSGLIGRNVRHTIYFENAVLGEEYIDDVHRDEISEIWEITFALPIYSRLIPAKLIGVLCVRLKAEELSSISGLYRAGVHEEFSGHIMVTKRDGLLISAPDIENEGLFKGNLLELGLKSVQLAIHDKDGYLVEVDDQGNQALIGYAASKGYGDFPGMGWVSLVVEDIRGSFAPVEELKLMILVVGSVVILIVVILSVYITRKMTRPILEISRVADKVAHGDLDQRIVYTSSDEVGALASDFNKMIDRLKISLNDLQSARDIAEAASHAKGQFLANMSHEIRTPLNGIIGMTELAIDTTLTEEQREYLEAVRTSADSLLTLINDILDFSKIEAGKLELSVSVFKLRSSLGNAMKALAIRAGEKGLNVAYKVSPDVPDRLMGDPGRLRQIIMNLVGNAIKFTKRGEVILEVEKGTIDNDKRDETVRLSFTIRDTGIGISPEQQDRIFESFTQADGTITRRYGGTGLGLAISSQLVKLMEGKIRVESRVGEGSIFRFSANFDLQQEEDEQDRDSKNVAIENLPVLVVDDDPTNRNILETMLCTWRMKPTLVQDAESALVSIKQSTKAGKPFSLVILDVYLPDINGFNLARRIKQGIEGEKPLDQNARIIIMTPFGKRGDANRCKQLGITTYLTKPINQSDLFDAITMTVGKMETDDQGMPLITRHTLREGRGGRAVLLAEDNPINQKLATYMLEKMGHYVVVTGDGAKAVEAFKERPFDVIMMDIQMPEMNGFEATAAIRELEKRTGGHVAIIAMTAHAMKGDKEKCLEAGMDGYISKPIKKQTIIDEIERLT